jgi:DinB family protein
MNLDRHANAFQTGDWVISDKTKWKVWWDLFWKERNRQPDPTADFPSVKEILERLNAVADVAWKGLLDATPEDLAGNRHAAPEWSPRTAGDAYFRTIAHTNSHVRQIWLLRGALGLTNDHAWPRQHWH